MPAEALLFETTIYSALPASVVVCTQFISHLTLLGVMFHTFSTSIVRCFLLHVVDLQLVTSTHHDLYLQSTVYRSFLPGQVGYSEIVQIRHSLLLLAIILFFINIRNLICLKLALYSVFKINVLKS